MLVFVLKIILWVLLGLIGLFLFAALLLLFVPFGYYAEMKVLDKTSGKIIINWLFNIIGVNIYFGQTQQFFIRIFCFKIEPKYKKTKKVIKRKVKKNKKQNREKDKLSFKDFLKIAEDILKYKDKDEIFRILKRYVYKTWKRIKPREFKIKGIIGFENPATTGYFFAILAILISFMKIDADIKGDFNEPKKEIDGFIKGRFMLMPLTIIFLETLLKKPILNLIKKLIVKKERVYERRI